MAINLEDFQRIDLRIGQVTEAQPVAGAGRLLKLEMDLGTERRTLVAGIAPYLTPEQLVGRKIVVVANLEPAVIRGIRSEGMLLAARGTGGAFSLLTVDQSIPNGAKVE